jgi:DNA primase
MKIDRINYQRVFPCGAYLTERIGFEATLDAGEDQRGAIEQMRQMAEDIHREKYPHYYEKKTLDTPHAEEPAIPADDVQPLAPEPEQRFSRSQSRLVKLIESAKDMNDLARFKSEAHKEGISYVYAARVKFFGQQLLTQ